MNEIRAVLFDMDGTLVDTEPCGMKTLREILHKFNIDLSDEEWVLFDKVWRRDGTDVTEDVFFADILKKYQIDISEKDFEKQFYQAYEQEIIAAELLPGAEILLQSLRGKYKLALVTASTQAQAQAVIVKNSWQGIFATVISFDEYKIKKPDPASFLMAAKKLEVEPRQCLVIEDSKNGCLAGKNAGMYVLGIRAGNKKEQDLSSADEIFQTLEEVKL